MYEVQTKSWFDYDEHRHLFMRSDGTKLAAVTFAALESGRDHAVNCRVSVKILFGADSEADIAPVMAYQRINLTNDKGVNGWSKVVEAIEGGISDEQWGVLVRNAVIASLDNWHKGSASHAALETVNLGQVQSPFLITPLVGSTGMTMHFSKPGSSKSMIALAVSVSVATGYPIFGAVPQTVGPVVYVDFEDVKIEHDQRYTAILNGIGWEGDLPNEIIHYKVSGRLVDQLPQIRRVVRQNKAVLVVVDSLGKARNTDASDGDATIKMTNAIESFGIPVLAIDHVTKEDNKSISNNKVTNPDAMMAIGSQFSTAGARLAWFFQEMPDSTFEVKRYNIFNTKHNHVRKQDPRSIKVEIRNNDRQIAETISFEVWDDKKFEVLLAEETYEMIAKWMHRAEGDEFYADEISEGLGMARTTVTSAFGRHKELFDKARTHKKRQYYRLSDAGNDLASRLISRNQAESVTQQGKTSDDST